MVEKVDETKEITQLGQFCTGIKGNKRDFYRIPLSQQDKTSLNDIIKKRITRDLFKKGLEGSKKYKFWKNHPVKAISYLDEVCRKQGMHFMSKSARIDSPIIKLLLRIKRWNKMEQLEQQKEAEKVESHNIEAKKNHEGTKHNTQMVQNTATLSPGFLKDIKDRSDALAEEDQYKKTLIKAAKEKGWLGVTVEEIDLDLTDTYRKISKQVERIDSGSFNKENLVLVSAMREIRKDKMDKIKFDTITGLKLMELEEKKKLRQRVNDFKMDEFVDVPK